MADIENTSTLDYDQLSQVVGQSLHALHTDGSTDPEFVESRLYPGAYGVLDTMQRHDLTELTLGEHDTSDPANVMEKFFEAAGEEFGGQGIAPPDLAFYQQATDIARQTDSSMADVLESVDAARPYDLALGAASDSAIDLAPASDTVSAASDGPLSASVEAAAQPSLEIAAQNYQEYDVHLMAYPLAELPGGFVSRDSHAFVVVTERGGNPFERDDALLVTRAGPDGRGASGSSESSSGSSFENEQSPNESGSDGDVYVATPEVSIRDIRDSAFTLDMTTIRGDIDEIRNEIADFREFINAQDIDYVPTNVFGEGSNSNTYAGDAYELLTGQEPENPHHGVFSGRRTPALENDLIDYEETDYANDFS